MSIIPSKILVYSNATLYGLTLCASSSQCLKSPSPYFIQGGGKCLADLCGALHCDQVIKPKVPKSKCNPAAATRNRLLCEVVFGGCVSSICFRDFSYLFIIVLQNLADSCFPIHQGLASSQLHGSQFLLSLFLSPK